MKLCRWREDADLAPEKAPQAAAPPVSIHLSRPRTVFSLIVVAASAVACGAGLSPAEALHTIKNHPAVETSDTVTVRSVLHEKGSADAIVKAIIDGQELTLRFRQVDGAWEWAYAEAGPGLLTPDVVLPQLRERNHRQRVTAWVRAHADHYEATIATIDAYSDDLPRRADVPFTEAEWRVVRRVAAELLERSGASPAEIASYEGPALDAWAREILVRFDDATRSALFVSLGPDGNMNTADDVVCEVKGTEAWDAAYGQALWNYGKSWRVPEGLDEIVQPYVSKEPPGHVEFSHVVG